MAELPDGLRLDLRAGMQLSAAENLGLKGERESCPFGWEIIFIIS